MNKCGRYSAPAFVSWRVCRRIIGDVVHLLAVLHFIFAGSPLIETTHNDLKFAPLTAITGAIVGVILNLAFCSSATTCCGHKQGEGMFDWPSAVIAVAAAVALFHYKTNVIHVINMRTGQLARAHAVKHTTFLPSGV